MLMLCQASLFVFGQNPYFSIPPTTQGTQIDQARDTEERIFAHRLARFIAANELYALPKFDSGYFTFHQGRDSEIFQLNYHHLFSRMAILSGSDTVFVNIDKQTSEVRLMSATFFYHTKWGFIQVIEDGPVKLAMRKKLEIRRRRQLGPAENPALVNTKEYFTTIYSPSNYQLPREEVTLWRNVDYFLIDEKSNIYLANQSGFRNVFAKKRSEIEKQMRQHYQQRDRIKFSEENDVRELYRLCTQKQ